MLYLQKSVALLCTMWHKFLMIEYIDEIDEYLVIYQIISQMFLLAKVKVVLANVSSVFIFSMQICQYFPLLKFVLHSIAQSYVYAQFINKPSYFTLFSGHINEISMCI